MIQKFVPLLVALSFAVAPVGARANDGTDGAIGDGSRQDAGDAQSSGRGLMEQGFELFLEGLRDEMAPSILELQDMAEAFGPAMREFWAEMGPALSAILDEVEDWSAYEPPVILPNGDILIRRKPDIPQTEPETPETGEDGQIEL